LLNTQFSLDMFYFVSKILIGESMVRIFKGSVGLGGGEEPACEPPLSGEEYVKIINLISELRRIK